MSGFLKHMDIAMCLLWITTEFLCLIGIIKYKKPILPPLSQLVIAPFEFAVVIFFVITHSTVNYAFFSYIAWVIIEILIIVYYYKFKLIPPRINRWYIPLLIIQTVILLVLILNVDGAFPFFGSFNTLLAIIIWYICLFNSDYPMIPFTLCVFSLKLCADLAGNIVYVADSVWFMRLILIGMVVVDLCFFPTWFVLHRKQKKASASVATSRDKK